MPKKSALKGYLSYDHFERPWATSVNFDEIFSDGNSYMLYRPTGDGKIDSSWKQWTKIYKSPGKRSCQTHRLPCLILLEKTDALSRQLLPLEFGKIFKTRKGLNPIKTVAAMNGHGKMLTSRNFKSNYPQENPVLVGTWIICAIAQLMALEVCRSNSGRLKTRSYQVIKCIYGQTV